MNRNVEELRAKYMQNPPEGMAPEDIRGMGTDDLLDTDYFLHEDVFGEGGFDEEGFYIF